MSAISSEVRRQIRDAAAELLRRKRCRQSLHAYTLSIDLPTVGPATCPDESIVGPSRNLMAKHHALMLDVLQRCVFTAFGRCMIFAPPGTAKSLYTSVVLPTWIMGGPEKPDGTRIPPGQRIILASYSDDIAGRQSRRCHDIVQQENYRQIWPEAPTLERNAEGDWSLRNKSEMLARGLRSGITGNRANGIIIDDPLKNREEADSETTRKKCVDEYTETVKSRLLEGAWVALIMTRWHEADLAGEILPEGYNGESGMIPCKDGMVWEVLNLQAECERADDPLGRKPGEFIWPEYYSVTHWNMHKNSGGAASTRAWSALYQQRPAPQGDNRFHIDMIDFYKPGTQPVNLAYIGAGDYAVTEGGNDFTELGVFGIDCNGELWEVDWWSKQSNTASSAQKTLDMIKRWKIPMWFNEGGVIDKAMGPLLNIFMRQQRVYADRRTIPSMEDKVAKCSSFQGRCAVGGENPGGGWNKGVVHFRDNANSRRIVQQLVSLPAGRYDDAADVCGLVGRAMDQFPVARIPAKAGPRGIKPFTAEWLESDDTPEKVVRYR